MTSSLHIDVLRYDAMVGTGGIGSGSFFALAGDHTLGREESRGGRFIDQRDYCKLHIISHYVQTLLGARFTTFPIGKVGADDAGRKLVSEMAGAGLSLKHLEQVEGAQTLFSFCFVYPDGSGGNLTTDDSACSRVDAAAVVRAEPEFACHAGRGIALAVPEVPLGARAALLDLAGTHGFFRAASFTTEEILAVLRDGLLDRVELLAVNVDEAAALAGVSVDGENVARMVGVVVRGLRERHPALKVSITAGRQGSWCWDGVDLVHHEAVGVEVVNTAGAGDAHLAGILAALAAGLSLPDAQALGTLVAGLSVTCPHTIHPDATRERLAALAGGAGVELPAGVKALLAGD